MRNRYSICVFSILIFICIAIIGFAIAEQENPDRTELTEPQKRIQDDAGDKNPPEENSGTDAVENSRTDTEQNAEESAESSRTEEPYRYIILEEDGHLLVYYSDNQTVFFDSGILSQNLPDEVRQELMTGIRFADEGELYEFLENYSS